MAKLTKKYLNEHHIFNSWDIRTLVGTKILIEYTSADNGRLTSRYAYWSYSRLADDGHRYSKDFTVTCREDKEPVLQQAILFVKNKYDVNITDKDVFGTYHPEGTLQKLQDILSKEA